VLAGEVSFVVSASTFDQDAQINFILDKPDIDGNVISIGKATLVANRTFSTSANIPSDFTSNVTVNYFATPNSSQKLGTSFTFQITQTIGEGMVQQTKVLQTFNVTLSQTTS
jgi:hypothetical protein